MKVVEGRWEEGEEEEEGGEKYFLDIRLDGRWDIHFGIGRVRDEEEWLVGVRRAEEERDGRDTSGRGDGCGSGRGHGNGSGSGSGGVSLSTARSSRQHLQTGGVLRVAPEGLVVQGGGGRGV